MRNILIPTDFSKNAWNALRYALHLFEQETCTFHLIHTYTPTAYAYNFGAGMGLIGVDSLQSVADMVFQDSQERLKGILERIEERYPNDNHRFKIKSAFNVLTDEINEVVRERHIDLIVMGTKGVSKGKKILFGSNALFVMKKAHCPILSIPSPVDFEYVENILFPNDYKVAYTKKNLQPISDFAQLNEAVIHCFHVSHEADFSIEQKRNKDILDHYFDNVAHDFQEVPDAKVTEAIAEYIHSHGIGLLAMTRRKHSILERLFFRQNISVIGMHLEIPFLVIPIDA